jgi:hypothetical protein
MHKARSPSANGKAKPKRAPAVAQGRQGKATADSVKAATLNLVRMKLSDLKPHPRNPRNHPEEGTPEYTALLGSLKHDYYDPIVWNKRNGMLVSGHLRHKILINLKYTQADVIVVDYDESTHLARMLSANKLIGTDDMPKMKDLLEDLDDGSLDLSALSGYCETELEKLMTQYHVDGENVIFERNSNNQDAQHASRTIHQCPKCGHEFE